MNAIRWFEIYFDDMQRAKTFYETVLDTTLEQVMAPDGELEMWQFPADVDAHGSGGALVRMNEMKAGGNCVDAAENQRIINQNRFVRKLPSSGLISGG